MRLNLKLKKVLATTAAATIMATAVPVVTYAADYDNHWAKEAITKWSEKEVLEGYEDGTFKPNNKVTRGELAAIIVRVFGLTDTSSAETYTDVEATKWYAEAIAKVSSAGIMNDYEDGTFKPAQEATREEAAYAIAKAYKVASAETNLTFKDQAKISDWAETEIASLVAGGYLNGNPDGTFRPDAALTRAEAVTMVDKITADLVNVAGVYSQDIEGHLVVNTKDVELKDMTITGNLYLAEGIGEGDVKLNNVTVLGDVIVEGGGVNTVHVLGQSKLNNIIVDKAGKNPVRVLLGNLVEVKGTITLVSTAILEGNAVSLSKVVIDGAAEPQLVGTLKIEEVIINKTTELVLVDGVTINTLTIKKDAVNTILRGRGEKSQIKNIIVEANGLELKKGFKFSKDKVVVGKDVTVLPKYPEAGGGGGGGSTSDSRPSVTEEDINITGLTVALKDKKVPVAIENNKINVVVNSKESKVIINDEEFTDKDVITSITAHEANNINTLNVALAASDMKINLQPGKAYTTVDLGAIAADGDIQGVIRKQIDTFAGLLGLTEDQENRVEDLLDNVLIGLQQYPTTANGEEVKVADLLAKAETLQAELQDKDVKAAYKKVEKELKTLGITVHSVDNNSISATIKLTVTVPKTSQETTVYEVEEIVVNVTYK